MKNFIAANLLLHMISVESNILFQILCFHLILRSHLRIIYKIRLSNNNTQRIKFLSMGLDILT